MARVFLSSLALILALAGCAKSPPAPAVVDAEIARVLPDHLRARTEDHRASPLHDEGGVPAPAGSFQIDVKAHVYTTEPLYIPLNPLHPPEDARIPEAVRDEVPKLAELAKWSYDDSYEPARGRPAPARPKLHGYLVQVADTGTQRDLWIKVFAEPRDDGWSIAIVEGEPQRTFAPALPRSRFDSSFLIYGSEEQKRDVATVRAAYEAWQHQQALLRELEPQIKAIEDGEAALVAQYEQELETQSEAIMRELASAAKAHELRMSDISRITSDHQDNFASRNRLWQEENAKFDTINKEIRTRLVPIFTARLHLADRAHAETQKRIRELKNKAGLP